MRVEDSPDLEELGHHYQPADELTAGATREDLAEYAHHQHGFGEALLDDSINLLTDQQTTPELTNFRTTACRP